MRGKKSDMASNTNEKEIVETHIREKNVAATVLAAMTLLNSVEAEMVEGTNGKKDLEKSEILTIDTITDNNEIKTREMALKLSLMTVSSDSESDSYPTPNDDPIIEYLDSTDENTQYDNDISENDNSETNYYVILNPNELGKTQLNETESTHEIVQEPEIKKTNVEETNVFERKVSISLDSLIENSTLEIGIVIKKNIPSNVDKNQTATDIDGLVLQITTEKVTANTEIIVDSPSKQIVEKHSKTESAGLAVEGTHETLSQSANAEIIVDSPSKQIMEKHSKTESAGLAVEGTHETLSQSANAEIIVDSPSKQIMEKHSKTESAGLAVEGTHETLSQSADTEIIVDSPSKQIMEKHSKTESAGLAVEGTHDTLSQSANAEIIVDSPSKQIMEKHSKTESAGLAVEGTHETLSQSANTEIIVDKPSKQIVEKHSKTETEQNIPVNTEVIIENPSKHIVEKHSKTESAEKSAVEESSIDMVVEEQPKTELAPVSKRSKKNQKKKNKMMLKNSMQAENIKHDTVDNKKPQQKQIDDTQGSDAQIVVKDETNYEVEVKKKKKKNKNKSEEVDVSTQEFNTQIVVKDETTCEIELKKKKKKNKNKSKEVDVSTREFNTQVVVKGETNNVVDLKKKKKKKNKNKSEGVNVTTQKSTIHPDESLNPKHIEKDETNSKVDPQKKEESKNESEEVDIATQNESLKPQHTENNETITFPQCEQIKSLPEYKEVCLTDDIMVSIPEDILIDNVELTPPQTLKIENKTETISQDNQELEILTESSQNAKKFKDAQTQTDMMDVNYLKQLIQMIEAKTENQKTIVTENKNNGEEQLQVSPQDISTITDQFAENAQIQDTKENLDTKDDVTKADPTPIVVGKKKRKKRSQNNEDVGDGTVLHQPQSSQMIGKWIHTKEGDAKITDSGIESQTKDMFCQIIGVTAACGAMSLENKDENNKPPHTDNNEKK